MLRRRFTFLLAIGFVSLASGCAKNNLSERDSKREQLRASAETKRKELEVVAGEYQGNLSQTNGIEQTIALKLEIKDIPQAVEGQVDPVLTPILTGFLRFNLGQDANEYIGFAIQKAEFDPRNDKLDLVANNNEFKELIIALRRTDSELVGSWTAPSVSTSGTARLRKGSATATGEPLQGEYGGVLYREPGTLYQYGHLTLRTTFQPPDGVKVFATARLIFGDWNSTEYLTYRFEGVQFNPITGQLVIKGEGLDVVFVGNWAKGELKGEWSSSYTGKMGRMVLKRSSIPVAVPGGTLFDALRGTYQGRLVNNNPDSNLPERVLMSFVTSQDLTQPNGVKVTGSMRLYLGDFNSTEFLEMPFTDVQYNFFTGMLVAKTAGEYKLTFKGEVGVKKIKGKFFSDALGEVGDSEVVKK